MAVPQCRAAHAAPPDLQHQHPVAVCDQPFFFLKTHILSSLLPIHQHSLAPSPLSGAEAADTSQGRGSHRIHCGF